MAWVAHICYTGTPLTWWASAKFPRRMQDASSDSGGENIMGMSEFWDWGCNRPSSSFLPDTAFRLPSVGTQECGDQGSNRNWRKTILLAPPTKLLSSRSLSKSSISRAYFFLSCRANLCYHLWIQDLSTIFGLFTSVSLCWRVTPLIVRQPFPFSLSAEPTFFFFFFSNWDIIDI